MKRIVALILIMATLVCGGCANAQPLPQSTQYTATFLTLFDTLTTVIGYAGTKEQFTETANGIRDELMVYHRLFDVYNDYEGIANIKTINDNAGIAPVKVDPIIIAFLRDCESYYAITGGNVNVAMGGVLRLWHIAREDGIDDPANAYLPDAAALSEASNHCAFDNIVIDEAASTVFITDAEASLDVGAVAKGWSVQRVAENAPKGMLISVGGNVVATGPKEGDNPWIIGIQNPDGEGNLHTVFVKNECVVTSGDYQRGYAVGGKWYHHIIDPKTRMPAEYWRSVSVVLADSGLADALSTALFILPYEDGLALAERYGAAVLWVAADGTERMTESFKSILNN